MPVRRGFIHLSPAGRGVRNWRSALLVIAIVSIIAVSGVFDDALAQTSPFGGARPAPPQLEVGGIIGWLLAKQAEFYRALSGLIRAAKTDGTAVWGLLGVSFLYGVFHAAGPGHGKAVISSYLLANEETWRRGVALSFASALLQAVVAVALVSVAAFALNATAKSMNDAVRVIEIVSYALISLVGARLTWVKGRAFLQAFHAWRMGKAGFVHSEAAHVHTGDAHAHAHAEHAHAHAHAHAEHSHVHGEHAHTHAEHAHAHAEHTHPAAGHAHAAHHHCGHAHDDHAHQHDDHCGHSHGPEPEQLAGCGGWQRGLSAIIAVGLRPCSGAILVLVFALAQGLFWAGVASTFVMGFGTAITVAAIATFAVAAKTVAKRIAVHRAGAGVLAMRGIEAAAAVVVLAFGLALLAGYMVTERTI
ncbi:MAG TPA: nickel transporter [Rhodoplanes sp.]|nr:nickel transporter [Rhodoplanes sp.]